MVGKVLSDELSCMQSGLVSKGPRFNNRNDHTVLLYSVVFVYMTFTI